MSTILYWFRSDLRLHDAPGLLAAIRAAEASGAALVPVFVRTPAGPTPWGFERVGPHRRAFLDASLRALDEGLRVRGSGLCLLEAPVAQRLPTLARRLGATLVFGEKIDAPEEHEEEAALRGAGLELRLFRCATMLDGDALPFPPEKVPDVFTAFRNGVERARVEPPKPLAAPASLPPFPLGLDDLHPPVENHPLPPGASDPRAGFPYGTPAFAGGERAALDHLAQYLDRGLPHTYKATRDALTGIDVSSKLSPWLAAGTLSARLVYADLKRFEAERGANEGSYWLWFELLWRDHFRFLHRKHGARLYRARGLNDAAPRTPPHDRLAFERWCRGETGEPLIDAAMRELSTTGYLSNRMRQIVAGFLVHELCGDWRAGAAWFEAQLVDFDVHSNQGNWLYIAGLGTDPRGGRRFDLQWQAQKHDPHGRYRALWA